ncbi:cell division protein FtsK [Clostridium sp. C2-6-12]|uniref:type IV secretory system conjugative DNA transfer family protein n=1 Tax=Clostridium sp. C2-6-12 TaxID=2698832 RepID=UPI0013684EF4|nr:cell division protein FtsK [Clostridium sp. C2-6-12]
MDIDILFNQKYLSFGISEIITWNPEIAPHIITIGSTGSGKTYFTKLLLGKIALKVPDSQIYICDFKGDDDFSFLDNCSRFYRFMNCSIGLQQFYEHFQKRQKGEEKNNNMIVLFFDEWASYCNSLDKKMIEEEKKKLSNLLMLGRSFRVHVIISQQRADATYFNSARDNFNFVVGLGNLSEESKNMLFHEFKSEMLPDRKQGTGYMLTNGSNLISIQVPTISNMQKLQKTIKVA